MRKTLLKKYDILGISSALICLVHCLAFPLLAVLPIGHSHNHIIDIFFVLIGVYAVAKVTKNHRFSWLSTMLWGGILMIAVSVILSVWLHRHTFLLYLGVTLLLTGHFIHFKNRH